MRKLNGGEKFNIAKEVQPRTSPSKFGGKYSILFNRVLSDQSGIYDSGGYQQNLRRLVLGWIRIRIRSRSVFEKKENLGVCAKQKVRLTRLGKYYVV